MKKLQMLVMTMSGWLLVGADAMAINIQEPTSVPVPGVLALMAAGMGALYLFRRK